MERLSFTQIFSLCLITIHSLTANIFIVLRQLSEQKREELTILFEEGREREKTQLKKLLDKGMVKVAIYENFAYWIINNEIYRAKIDKSGKIDSDSAKVIDAFKLSEKEVNKILSIIDTIQD